MTSYEEKLKQFAQTDDLPRLNAGQAAGAGLWVAATVEDPLSVAMIASASQPLGVGGTFIVGGTLAGAAALVMEVADDAGCKNPPASNAPRGQQTDVERVQPVRL
jgi:predicted NAD/FAD-dependent oxidoreductase